MFIDFFLAYQRMIQSKNMSKILQNFKTDKIFHFQHTVQTHSSILLLFLPLFVKNINVLFKLFFVTFYDNSLQAQFSGLAQQQNKSNFMMAGMIFRNYIANTLIQLKNINGKIFTLYAIQTTQALDPFGYFRGFTYNVFLKK